MTNPLKKAEAKYVAALDPIELAIVIARAVTGMRPPEGVSDHAAFFALQPEAQELWLRAANITMEWWRLKISEASKPS